MKSKLINDYPSGFFSDIPELPWRGIAASIVNGTIRPIPVYLKVGSKNNTIGKLWLFYWAPVENLLYGVNQLLKKINFDLNSEYDVSFYSKTFTIDYTPWRMLTLYYPLQEYNLTTIKKLTSEDISPKGEFVPASNLWDLADFVVVSPKSKVLPILVPFFGP